MVQHILKFVLILSLCQSAWAGAFSLSLSATEATDAHCAHSHSESATMMDMTSHEADNHDCCDNDSVTCNHTHCYTPAPVTSAMPAVPFSVSPTPVTTVFARSVPMPLPAESRLPDRPPSTL
ncbi:MAG: hypothetical protein VW258_09035 [Thalassolituus sp.]